MRKPNQHKKLDVNQLAHHLVQTSTVAGASPIPDQPVSFPTNLSDYMATIGKRGGQIGGKKRLQTMTEQERRESAVNAAKARWAKVKR
jgi:hypothetical protein